MQTKNDWEKFKSSFYELDSRQNQSDQRMKFTLDTIKSDSDFLKTRIEDLKQSTYKLGNQIDIERMNVKDYKMKQIGVFEMFSNDINERFYRQQEKNIDTEQAVEANKVKQNRLANEVMKVNREFARINAELNMAREDIERLDELKVNKTELKQKFDELEVRINMAEARQQHDEYQMKQFGHFFLRYLPV